MSHYVNTIIHITLSSVLIYGYYYYNNKQQELKEELEKINLENKILEYRVNSLNNEKIILERKIDYTVKDKEKVTHKLNEILEYYNLLVHEKEEKKQVTVNDDELYDECYDILPCNNIKKKSFWSF
jgi:hypothetical protein